RTGAAPLGRGQGETQVDRVHLEGRGEATPPSKIASREALAKRRAQPVTCIGQYAAEAHARRSHTIDLSERDLRLGTCRSIFDWNTCTLQPPWVTCPTLRKKKTQRHHHRHFATGERQ